MSHTYAILELSKAAVDEIRKKLEAAGYEHAFHDDGVIDMHGIAVSYGPADKHPWQEIFQHSAVKECPLCGIQRLGDLWRKTRDDRKWNDSEFPACQTTDRLHDATAKLDEADRHLRDLCDALGDVLAAAPPQDGDD